MTGCSVLVFAAHPMQHAARRSLHHRAVQGTLAARSRALALLRVCEASWLGLLSLVLPGSGAFAGITCQKHRQAQPWFYTERHRAPVLRAKAVPSSVGWQGSRALRRGGRGPGAEAARPGVMSNGAPAGPGAPLPAHTPPGTSPGAEQNSPRGEKQRHSPWATRAEPSA